MYTALGITTQIDEMNSVQKVALFTRCLCGCLARQRKPRCVSETWPVTSVVLHTAKRRTAGYHKDHADRAIEHVIALPDGSLSAVTCDNAKQVCGLKSSEECQQKCRIMMKSLAVWRLFGAFSRRLRVGREFVRMSCVMCGTVKLQFSSELNGFWSRCVVTANRRLLFSRSKRRLGLAAVRLCSVFHVLVVLN